MGLHPVDWLLIIGYCVVALGIGLYFSKRAGRNISEFFVAGRNLPWWLAGTSIVATTFAADTPLAVSKIARESGIYGNWFWWSALMGGMMCVFFYARLWRRANVLTDVEFIELRYEGRPASVLRGFMAVYGGVLQNCIVMGWVILAMTKICGALFDLEPVNVWMAGATGIEFDWGKLLLIAVLMLFALGYTVLSGFWGVVMTDLVQFAMAMTGSIALAGIVLWKLGGPAGLVEQVRAAPDFKPGLLSFVPDFATATRLAIITFVVQISIQWWGGGQGGGYLAQRLFATKNETHSALAALWFNIAHYVLRPWPWIIVGLGSMAFFTNADLVDPATGQPDLERAYPLMIVRFLPTGLRGLMIASMLAAFMSTIDTQLNWGASYLVNDLYKRFLRPDASDRHYVGASRIAMVLIVVLGALAAWQSESITDAWIFLAKLTAGAGLVGLLRWYWWRVNAWAEISALLASLAIACAVLPLRMVHRIGIIPDTLMTRIEWVYSSEAYPILFTVIVAVCAAIWISVMFLTQPVSENHLSRFYRRVRPGGWWAPIARKHPDLVQEGAVRSWLGWLAGVVCVYAALFGFGYLCLSRPLAGSMFLILAAASGSIMVWQASRPGAVESGFEDATRNG